ncbi:hypothetical protein AB0383_22850 [Amycolatopsis sp. NPDC051373]|uniref:hypothetical protein n=1 Tax=Amycolatopsis sp. NPDC051373 TaxID=3155801 RepID=UPI00344D695B
MAWYCGISWSFTYILEQRIRQLRHGLPRLNPSINRFTTRDSYNGALADLNLGTDPWTANRYAFTGGNPISRIELDGHEPMLPTCAKRPEPRHHQGAR